MFWLTSAPWCILGKASKSNEVLELGLLVEVVVEVSADLLEVEAADLLDLLEVEAADLLEVEVADLESFSSESVVLCSSSSRSLSSSLVPCFVSA